MKRHNQILAGVLVIQIVLSVVVFWPKPAVTGEGGPLFPDLEADDVVALTIEDEEGNRVALRQTAGEWALPEADGYPAQADKITPVLEKIAGLTTGRLVARTDASHKRLKISPDDFVRRIDFETVDGMKHILYLGSSPSYGATHVRLDGQSETYLGKDISAWEINATAASWVDTTYLRVDQETVTRMTLENAYGTFVFTKETDEAGEDHWAMEGLAEDEILNEENVSTSFQRATTINMVAPLGKEEKAAYGMNEPNAVVTLETAGKKITVRVGAKDTTLAGNPAYIIISSESPYHVRASEFSVKNLVERTRDDFLQEPPTPTPEPTPEEESS